MSTDTSATVDPGSSAIEMDVDLHKRLFEAIGCTSAAKIAAATGVTEKTVYRARQGIIGEVFMAATITALRRHTNTLRRQGLRPPTLDTLFRVVPGRRAA